MRARGQRGLHRSSSLSIQRRKSLEPLGNQLSMAQARTREGKSERMWSRTDTYLIS